MLRNAKPLQLLEGGIGLRQLTASASSVFTHSQPPDRYRFSGRGAQAAAKMRASSAMRWLKPISLS